MSSGVDGKLRRQHDEADEHDEQEEDQEHQVEGVGGLERRPGGGAEEER